MSNIYFSLFLALIFVQSCNQTSNDTLDNAPIKDLTRDEKIQKKWDDRIDSVSYAIGLDVAMRLDQQFDQFNHKRINKAINDYFTKSEYELEKEKV